MKSTIETRVQTRPPSRRGLFGGVAALLAGVTVTTSASATSSAAANPDAALLAVYDEFLRATAGVKKLEAEPLYHFEYNSPEDVSYEVRMEGVCTRQDDAFFAIMEFPALTLAGLRAKADTVRIMLEACVCVELGQTIVDIDEMGDRTHLIAWSLARDVLAMEGRA